MKYIKILLLALWVGLWAAGLSADQWPTVRWVEDGDTIVLSDGRRVRYIGIDAPEIAHGRRQAQPFGQAAKAFNRRLVLHRAVRLAGDRQKTDHYGRHLAYVYLTDGTLVNRALLARGLAFCLYRPPNTRHGALFLKTQQAAMQQGLGIWEKWKGAGGAVTGNRHSRRFHRPGCTFASHIARSNRVAFQRPWDALWAGYAPCRRCWAQAPK